MDTPKESPAPVVVVPIPAKDSRTLKLTTLLTWLSAALAVLPSALAYFLELMGDPEIASLISGLIPAKYRVAFGVIMLIVARRYGHLRRETTAPIVGTIAADNAQQLISPSHIAPDRK